MSIVPTTIVQTRRKTPQPVWPRPEDVGDGGGEDEDRTDLRDAEDEDEGRQRRGERDAGDEEAEPREERLDDRRHDDAERDAPDRLACEADHALAPLAGESAPEAQDARGQLPPRSTRGRRRRRPS